MSTDILWELFQKTGNISYYNLLKRIRSEEENEKEYDDESNNNRSDS